MKPSFRQKFQCRFDNLMSRGTPAMVGTLLLLSLVIVFIASAIIALAGFRQVGSDPLPFGETALGFIELNPKQTTRAKPMEYIPTRRSLRG